MRSYSLLVIITVSHDYYNCYLVLLWASVFQSVKWGRGVGGKGHTKGMTSSEDLKLTLVPALSQSLSVCLSLSLSVSLSCRGSREWPAAGLAQDRHSWWGHRGDHIGCPDQHGTHRDGRLLRRGLEVPGISSGLFSGHRAGTECLGSSEGAAVLGAVWAGSWGIDWGWSAGEECAPGPGDQDWGWGWDTSHLSQV